MHYRNGREAKNGDKIVQLDPHSGEIKTFGELRNAKPGNDYCNGQILITSGGQDYGPAIIVGACLCDCLHVDEVAALLAEKGLDKRPEGK